MLKKTLHKSLITCSSVCLLWVLSSESWFVLCVSLWHWAMPRSSLWSCCTWRTLRTHKQTEHDTTLIVKQHWVTSSLKHLQRLLDTDTCSILARKLLNHCTVTALSLFTSNLKTLNYCVPSSDSYTCDFYIFLETGLISSLSNQTKASTLSVNR